MKSLLRLGVAVAICLASFAAYRFTHKKPLPDELVLQFASEWTRLTDSRSTREGDGKDIEDLVQKIRDSGQPGIEAAIKGAKSTDEKTRQASITLLSQLKEPGAAAMLAAIASKGAKEDRLVALEGLEMLHPPYGHDQFLQVLKEKNMPLMSVALRALRPFHEPKLVPLVVPYLDSSSPMLQSEAIQLLGECGGEEAYQVLLAHRKLLEKAVASRVTDRSWSPKKELAEVDESLHTARNNRNGYKVHS